MTIIDQAQEFAQDNTPKPDRLNPGGDPNRVNVTNEVYSEALKNAYLWGACQAARDIDQGLKTADQVLHEIGKKKGSMP